MENGNEMEVVKKGGFFGKIIALVLGLILGILATVGGVIGAGYWAVTQPVDKVIGTVDNFANVGLYDLLFGNGEDPDAGFLNEKYASETMLNLFKEVGSTLGALGNDGTINDVAEVSPFVKKKVNELINTIKTDAGIDLDADEFTATPITGMGDYLKTTLMEMPAGDLFGNFSEEGLSPILMAICYGTEDVDYKVEDDGSVTMLGDAKATTVEDLIASDMDGLLDNIAVDAILEVDSEDSITRAIAYGSADRYTVKTDGSIEMNPIVYTFENKGDGEKFYDNDGNAVNCTYEPIAGTANYKLTFVEGEGENAKTVTYYASSVTKTATKRYNVFKDAEMTEPVRYRKMTLADLNEDTEGLVNSVTLADALGVKDDTAHKVLLSMAYGEKGVDWDFNASGKAEPINGAKLRTIGDLRDGGQTLIDDVQLSDVLGADVEDKMIMYILYGKEDIHYSVDPATQEITMLRKRIAIAGNLAFNEYGEPLNGTLTPIDGGYTYTESYTENGVSHTTVYVVGEAIKNGDVQATLPVVIEKEPEDEKANALLYYLNDADGGELKYQSTRLGDLAGEDNALSKLTDRLTLGEILGEDSVKDNKIFKHLQDSTVKDLPTAITNLTIGDIFHDEMYYHIADESDLAKYGADAGFAKGDFIDEFGKLWKKLVTQELWDSLPINADNVEFDDVSNKYYKFDENNYKIAVGDYVTVTTVGSETKYFFYMRQYDATFEVYDDPKADDKEIINQNPDGSFKDSFIDHNGHEVKIGDYLCEHDDFLYRPSNEAGSEGNVFKGTWKYMLTDETGIIRTDYKLTEDMNRLMDNMQANIHGAPLNSLYKDDILTLDPEVLESEINYLFLISSDNTEHRTYYHDNPKDTEFLANHNYGYHIGNNPAAGIALKMGQLTVEQLLDYVGAILHKPENGVYLAP